MPAALEEITVIFGREFHRKGEFFVAEAELSSKAAADSLLADEFLSLAPPLIIMGEADEDEFVPGLEYLLHGRHQTDAQGREAFKFSTFVRAKPHGRNGIIRYLQQAPGIGIVYAEDLWNAFSGDAVRILRETPDIAVAGVNKPRFTIEIAHEAAAVLEEMSSLENCSIDLIDLLAGHGFPKSTPRKCIKEWGNTATQEIRDDPYLLMRFRGVGFKTTDKLYLHLKHNPSALRRQGYCAWYSCASDTEGHTWFPRTHVIASLKDDIAGARVDPDGALKYAFENDLLTSRRNCPKCRGTKEIQPYFDLPPEPCPNCRGTGGAEFLAESKKARQEDYIARRVAAAMRRDSCWPEMDHPRLSSLTDHQREELGKALTSLLAILAGSPGTGKTFCAAALIGALIDLYGSASIAVVAPTGKAAVRISEALANYNLPIKATTIHRLLGVAAASEGSWTFDHDEENPLDVRFLIADEMSMTDTSLMASLLAACGSQTHVLFVGDICQLPPVGDGAPLRDFIAAGIPTGQLTEIKRNAGSIVVACKAIREGNKFDVDARIELPEKNLVLLSAYGHEAATQTILEKFRAIREAGKYHPVTDCQVIVAVNEKSQLSRKILNQALQDELNPGGATAEGSPFRVGDKIVCLKNSMVPAAKEGDGEKDGKFFIANGEQARVVKVEPKLTYAELSNPKRLVKIPRGKNEPSDDDKKKDDAGEEKSSTGCEWDLAYAISCHKSQGSEWPVVMVVLDEYNGAVRVCSREWLYTAISRAKAECYLIGKKATAEGFCRRIALNHRRTFLKEMIRERVEDYRKAEMRHLVGAEF